MARLMARETGDQPNSLDRDANKWRDDKFTTSVVVLLFQELPKPELSTSLEMEILPRSSFVDDGGYVS